ncbi:MAG TPA: SMP-30/gluconolactonase/LRE family protein [Burkholderiaceae bacterium]|jgi:lactonase
MSPIPAGERNLPTALAEPYFKVSDEPMPLEALAFDRQGNLLFADIFGGRVLRLTPDRKLTVVFTDKRLTPTGIAVHQDGRIFVAGVGNLAAGRLIALDPDGSHPQTIVAESAGYVPDDLVFDQKGGIYFTDCKGTSTRPAGGVYHVAPDGKTITPLLPNMAMANGVTMSPDGKVLWATEFAAGRLHRLDLDEQGGIAPFGSAVPYQFTGRSPDSMRTDADGNVYVAMFHQARILVFSPNGVPIGQILLPGRDQNHFLNVSSMAFLPGSREMVIVAWDELGGRGAMIFKAQGFAKGATLFSHM